MSFEDDIVAHDRRKKLRLTHYEGEDVSYYPDDPNLKQYDENGLEMPLSKIINSDNVKNGFVHIDDICIHKLHNSADISSKYKNHKSKLKQLRLQTHRNIKRLAKHACPSSFKTLKEAHINGSSACGHVSTASIVNPDDFPESMDILKDVFLTSNKDFNTGVIEESILSSVRKYATKHKKHSYLNDCNTITKHRNDEFYKVGDKLKKNECVLIGQKGFDKDGNIKAHLFQMCKNRRGELIQLEYAHDNTKGKGYKRPYWEPMYGKKNKCFHDDIKCDSFSIMSKSKKNVNIFKNMDSESWTERVDPTTATSYTINELKKRPVE